ncbi:uncharacterized protein LAESUDRAFT_727795 [Laetiporus sulphureus 93-53]|uniref:TECPR1-like DysF domain-containing protein n=1 Tax=Laetiporus sulphureus 93-53 TaxID=1314785 RepID=A0A165DDC2_9APHY|nr:uncharacterized protein LAESUDRAFT_727795 [Laetiporus sulphureus 93-53]KZT04622.1 hypothetical protein LAESUDRAFT_727795 [Laetiporus sulphureus 93-53]
MSTSTENSSQPSLVEFLNTLPSPLITALVGLAPYIARIRRLALVLSWKSSWEDSWIAIAALWAICLLAEPGLRYMLPFAILLTLLIAKRRPKPESELHVMTEENLQQAISDLTIIHSLLPAILTPPQVPSQSLPALVLLRIFGLLYVPYLVLTRLVRLRVLLAVLGTIVLTWRARWAALVRRALWRSAYIRWAIYRLWAYLCGQPFAPQAVSSSSPTNATVSATATPTSDSHQPAEIVRFLFTIYENQRWWVGLDWTAALLPNERPSWCSASLQPVAPPATFALPASTTIYMPGPDGARVKRIARWKWAEPEWRVGLHREGEAAARVEKPLPKDEAPGTASASAARMLKAAGKIREGSVSMSGSPERSREKEKEKDEGENEERKDGEIFTDVDGWVYADNKWEGGNAKAGMGKYTRYRRWTRIAILIETVDSVGPGEMGIQRDGEEQKPATVTKSDDSPIPPQWEPAQGRHDSLDKKHHGDSAHGDEDSLTRRLKAVVQNAVPPP